MSYKCLECGNIFDEGEQASWLESRGECWGRESYETNDGCPLCHGDYEETVPCEICGSEHLEDELFGGVCQECIDQYKTDLQMCYNIGKNDTLEVELNIFLAELFTKSEIEEVLMDALVKSHKIAKVDTDDFVDKYKEWFGECLSEEVNKNEKK